MTVFKKRILPLFLSLVLCLGILTPVAWAKEVEAAPSPSVSMRTLLPAMLCLGVAVPVSLVLRDIQSSNVTIYALGNREVQVPASEVETYLSLGWSLTKPVTMSDYGVTRAAVVTELTAHESDNYYLGTPYQHGDWQSPNGDTAYNGVASLNCAGFVSYVMCKCGLDTNWALSVLESRSGAGSDLSYDKLSRASNWYYLAVNSGVTAFTFATKEEMLVSGVLEKGDIIVMYSASLRSGEDNHMGIFWGDTPDQDLLWHSGETPYQGNQIGAITPLAANCTFTVIKLD